MVQAQIPDGLYEIVTESSNFNWDTYAYEFNADGLNLFAYYEENDSFQRFIIKNVCKDYYTIVNQAKNYGLTAAVSDNAEASIFLTDPSNAAKRDQHWRIVPVAGQPNTYSVTPRILKTSSVSAPSAYTQSYFLTPTDAFSQAQQHTFTFISGVPSGLAKLAPVVRKAR